jgi:hypothetical protein
MSKADPLATAFCAVAAFEALTAPVIAEDSLMTVDPVVTDDGRPGLVVHGDGYALDGAMGRVGPVLSVVRIAAGNIHMADVAVEYRPIQPVMEVR